LKKQYIVRVITGWEVLITMTKINNVKVSAKERTIDETVEKQAFSDDAWGTEMEVNPKLKQTSIRLSVRTIQRAKIFAHIHHQRGYQSWLKHVIEERISTEYAIYKKLVKQMTKQH
jgi:hypothetical protein